MNVLSLIYAPVFGGPHNRMSIIAKMLEPQGIKTTVLLPSEGQVAADRMRARGVDVVMTPMHRMRAVPDPRAHYSWLRSLRAEVDTIAALIEEREIDVVATNSLPNLHGGLAARKADVACVWQLIDTFPPMIARRVYMPAVLRMSDVVMTTGRKVAEGHPGTTKLGDRWVNFFPCVDVEKFRADPALRRSAREELGLPQDVPVIGNVATISPMKGHRNFIRAAADLSRTHPDVHFVILGSTHLGRETYYRDMWAEAEALGLRLGERLIVTDPGARVSELEQAFDMFWMTSEPRSEGIPTAIGEAKSLGLPVVTTDVGSTSECVTDGVSGFVVPAYDHAAIAESARRILDDPELYRSMSSAARTEAEAEYASEHGAEQHRIAFEKAIDHHATKAAKARKPAARAPRQNT